VLGFPFPYWPDLTCCVTSMVSNSRIIYGNWTFPVKKKKLNHNVTFPVAITMEEINRIEISWFREVIFIPFFWTVQLIFCNKSINLSGSLEHFFYLCFKCTHTSGMENVCWDETNSSEWRTILGRLLLWFGLDEDGTKLFDVNWVINVSCGQLNHSNDVLFSDGFKMKIQKKGILRHRWPSPQDGYKWDSLGSPFCTPSGYKWSSPVGNRNYCLQLHLLIQR